MINIFSGNWKAHQAVKSARIKNAEGRVLKRENDAECLIPVRLELKQQCQYA